MKKKIAQGISSSKVKYLHTEVQHNMRMPRIVVSEILKLLPPFKNVVDVGCGLGTWLRAFKENGIKEVMGLDGKWYNPDLLFKNIDESEFKCINLEETFNLVRRFDLVLCIEVAEHIAAEFADCLVESLVSAGKIIIFSAAIPGQGGFNHINEQFPNYWAEKFKKYDYYFYDILRPLLWDNDEVGICKQNIFIVAPLSFCLSDGTQLEPEIKPVIRIHPSTYLAKITYIERWNSGIRQFVPHIFAKMLLKTYYMLPKTIQKLIKRMFGNKYLLY